MVVTICLNMIVKNESKIITRLLQSVINIVDTYIICDTGSTDNTPCIITDFFTKYGIHGEVIHEPFKNFGYNRTFALQSARGKATYALLLDADMILQIEPSFDKQSLTAESYLLVQKNGSLSYHNTRLIRLDVDAKCVCPTHEYYELPVGSRTEKLDSMWILDIGDGGTKSDKFERDIRLLKAGLETEPENARYYFYLANSFFHLGRFLESIPYYKRRIELGGWHEEVFYAHLNLGHAFLESGQDELAICTWIDGYNLHPARAETIYEIAKYYRKKGKNKIGMQFALIGKQIPYPKNDTLFIHNDVYDTGLDYEISILGYYNGYPNLHKITQTLMNKMPHLWDNLLSNYKFSSPMLSSYLTKKIGGVPLQINIPVCGTRCDLFGSNPCIFKVGDKYMINIRMVNYHLHKNGRYHFPLPNINNKIITVNQIWNLDTKTLERIGTPCNLVPTEKDTSLQYLGIEDWKPYLNKESGLEKWLYMGTVQCPKTGNIAIGYGVFDMDIVYDDNDYIAKPSLDYKLIETKWNKKCEKNWVFFGSDCKIIYQWFPLTIGKIVENNYLEILEERPMPNFFRHIRGSTHGCEIKDEIWFLAHTVDNNSQPHEYYHFFVVFDKVNFGDIKLNRWSHLCKFEGEKIECALGLIVEETRILISYSKWDRDPTIGIYDKSKLEKEIF